MAKERVSRRHKNEIRLPEDELIAFIHKSKKLSFAGSSNKVYRPDGTCIFSHRELPWLYTDTYSGNRIERGQENVYYDMVLVWSMLYRGGYYIPFWEKQGVLTKFLRAALSNAPKDFPIRGPKEFKMENSTYEGEKIDGGLLYHNQWAGDIGHFVGREFMYWKGKLVFYHDYIGGIVRNRYFPSRIMTASNEHGSPKNDWRVLNDHPDLQLPKS